MNHAANTETVNATENSFESAKDPVKESSQEIRR